MSASWPGVGPQPAWGFNSATFSWVPGNKLAVDQPLHTDIAELTGAYADDFDDAIAEGDLCAVHVDFTHATPEAPGAIQISARGGDWIDLSFDEGIPFGECEVIAGSGSGLAYRGGDTSGPCTLIGIIDRINLQVIPAP